MKPAIKNGCNLVTHLYSCTSTITRDKGFRRLGVIETAFLYDNLFVEIIADGKHLPKDLLKLIDKIKGVCRLKDRSAFAGSIATANRLIRVMVNEAEVSLVDAVKMLTYNPAKIFNLNKGEIKENKDADIIVFDDNIEIKSVFVKGERVR